MRDLDAEQLKREIQTAAGTGNVASLVTALHFKMEFVLDTLKHVSEVTTDHALGLEHLDEKEKATRTSCSQLGTQ